MITYILYALGIVATLLVGFIIWGLIYIKDEPRDDGWISNFWGE